MEFDQLLRRYLDGTLSEKELERFQYLLDRVPEYKSELRDTLEIRSILHDDALNLATPASLSDHVRIAVSSSFAADAVEAVEERRSKRRAFIAPLRIAAGSLVAVCILAGVALTPTLPLNLVGILGASSSGAPNLATREVSDARAPFASTLPTAPGAGIPSREAGSLRAQRNADAVLQNSTTAPILPPEVSIAALDNAATEGFDVPRSSGSFGTSTSADGQQPRSLRRDLATNLFGDPRTSTPPSLGPVATSAQNSDSIPNAEASPPSFALHTTDAKESDRRRRISFGLVLGSGQVAEIKSLTALLQNSYYFSFGVNNYDRIGIEMGASSFDRQERIAVTPVSGPFAKVSLGSPDEPGQVKLKDKATTTTSPEIVERHFQQQITYGAVFYDRRLKVNSSWDLCGRLTVGGADDAVVGNVRAYAAYTPTANKNITLTMGVGGAGLFNLTARDNNVSGNYGVYYGIETGF